jgi:hypothetical protein
VAPKWPNAQVDRKFWRKRRFFRAIVNLEQLMVISCTKRNGLLQRTAPLDLLHFIGRKLCRAKTHGRNPRFFAFLARNDPTRRIEASHREGSMNRSMNRDQSWRHSNWNAELHATSRLLFYSLRLAAAYPGVVRMSGEIDLLFAVLMSNSLSVPPYAMRS